jgi:broad specificity phosphatase PhoE
MSSYRIIQTATIISKGKAIAIEIALTEDADFIVIENGLWNGKSHLTQAAARAYANRVWQHIRNAEAAAA